jgi:Rrf2 family protein
VEGTNLLITRETDYALRILRALAAGEQLTSGEICQREILPQNFAYKILKKLNKAGIVHIARGAEGGCRLIADLKELSLYDLMGIIETKKAISSCMEDGYNCAWRQKFGAKCNVHGNLTKIQRVLDDQLKSYSIYKILFQDNGD